MFAKAKFCSHSCYAASETGATRRALSDWLSRASPEPNSGCHLWTGACDNYGYPQVRKDGRQKVLTREIYEHFFGSIPAGLFVCHRCDVRCCINPHHLFLGTPLDNVVDCVTKGRHTRGSKVATAILDEAAVLKIRDMSDRRPSDLAAEFGISISQIYRVRRGEAWRHV
jgi:hypothetical protein